MTHLWQLTVGTSSPTPGYWTQLDGDCPTLIGQTRQPPPHTIVRCKLLRKGETFLLRRCDRPTGLFPASALRGSPLFWLQRSLDQRSQRRSLRGGSASPRRLPRARLLQDASTPAAALVSPQRHEALRRR